MNEVGIGAGVGMAAVAMVGTIVTAILQARTAQHKTEFDTKFLLLEMSQKQCLEDHQECKDETCAIKIKLEKCEEDHKESGKDRVKMWHEIDKLKAASV